MAKVYSAPKEIKEPKFDFRDLVGSKESEQNYVKAVSDYCKQNSKDKAHADYIGEVYSIPHADSKAFYSVFSIKPVVLIHLAIGDCWDSQWANRATASDIKKQIDFDKKWKAMAEERRKKLAEGKTL